ncbi:MAG TPA: hypothetical protein ENI26_09375 [Methylophaga aminisulfidivorans]|uniref:Uncharacterized protein n=2 Tax=root TaxID=1 RepID=A0A7C1W0M5_9GAMM|nr:hypothetical protein [Methylophaga aminisulfidivorans]HEC74564.1 hypothetical protein [Methylophaga aminisulfidivorans]
MSIAIRHLSAFTLLLSPLIANADGSAIDKVYHPYVEPLEQEFEWRMITADGDSLQKFSYGQSVSDRLYIEGYLVAADQQDNFHLSSVELEVKYQLTEQGEYVIDWGYLGELERSTRFNGWEYTNTLLMEKQWGNWVGAANLSLVYEWGSEVDNELETAAALQAKYRLSRHFEPAIELYAGQDSHAIGPVALGDLRLGPGKKLHWETGVLFGVDDKTPDTTLRFLTEFEF